MTSIFFIRPQRKMLLFCLLCFVMFSSFSTHQTYHHQIDNTSIKVKVYGPVYEGNIYTALWKTNDNPNSTPCAIIFSPDGEKVLYHQRGLFFSFSPLINDMSCLCFFADAKRFEWILLNNKFQEIRRYRAIDLLHTDRHEFVLKKNGNVMLIGRETIKNHEIEKVYEHRIFQEITPEKKVVFQWSTSTLLTEEEILNFPCRQKNLIDYAHSNSIWVDRDGHYLFSHRNLSETTKVHSKTREILWRLGGPYNQFTFYRDKYYGPLHQHDVSRLPNGNILLFDNRMITSESLMLYDRKKRSSRVVEYAINEKNKTAKLVWEYQLHHYCNCMGSAQRLPNGNTLICLRDMKGPFSKILEVTPQKEKVLEIIIPKSDGVTMYRAYKK